MPHSSTCKEEEDLIQRYVPFYVKALSWKIGRRRRDSRLGVLFASVALYVLAIAVAWLTGDRFRILQVRLFHYAVSVFFVGTLLLTHAYQRTQGVLDSFLALCPSQKCAGFLSRNLQRMYCSPWQYIVCAAGSVLFLILFLLLGGREVPLTFAFFVYACVGGGTVIFFIFPGVWLAVTSASFVIALSQRTDLNLLPGVPGATTALRNISNWVGTMSIYFAVESALLIFVALATNWPNQSLHASLAIAVISAGGLFVILYLVFPQLAIAAAVKREKQRQLVFWTRQLDYLRAASETRLAPHEVLPYVQIVISISSSPNYPMLLAGLSKTFGSLLLPLAGLIVSILMSLQASSPLP